LGAKFTVIVGEEEFRNKRVIVRDMENHSQKEIELTNLIVEIRGT
ncbi:MAG: hypothetical protein COW10_00930, partial [Candidatus Omnitrophica bacterium CG12_big_fil_rev_8_21_14_0_65_42_8]